MNVQQNNVAFWALLVLWLTMPSNVFAQEPAIIKLEQTIRANQEQPKVLSIVPWQSPKTKQALPSPIVERINKKFTPLKRDELRRQIQMLNSQNIPQTKG